jgi:streptogramin lyase
LVFDAPITIAGDGTVETIKAFAKRAGFEDSVVVTATFTIDYSQVSTPQLSPAGGTYDSDQFVTIACSTPDVTIYYTIDGSTPGPGSFEYSSPVSVYGDGTALTIKAIALKAGMKESTVANASYAISYAVVSSPAFSPPGGTYSTDQSVTITSATPDAVLYYTTDGSTPVLGLNNGITSVYVSPVPVSGDLTALTIKAIAARSGMADSPVASASYLIDYNLIAAPVFSPPGNTYSGDLSVSITCSTPGVDIYYTLDGSPPTTSSALYGGPIEAAGDGTSLTITAFARKAGRTDSPAAYATYLISYPQAAQPGFSPPGGIYQGAQDVTLTSSSSGVSIRYTIDGSLPTSATGSVYAGPISVSANKVLKAIAYGSGWKESGVASASYSITHYTSGPGGFGNTWGISLDATGRIDVADSSNHRIVRVNAMDGSGWVSFGASGSGEGQFVNPAAVAIDGSGRIYIADRGNHRVVRIDDMSGAGWTEYGTGGYSEGRFSYPSGIAVDQLGRVYVSDSNNDRIVRVDDMTGAGWSALGVQFGGSGTGAFQEPSGVAVDSNGRIYVADEGNNRIVRVDDMTGAGWIALGSQGTGTGSFRFPTGVAVDAAGMIYVSDEYNDRVVRVSDMDGSGWVSFGTSGTVPSPTGVAVHATGSVFVSLQQGAIVSFIMPLP